MFAEFAEIYLAIGIRFDVFDFVSGDDYGCGIRAVRGVGDENFFARVAVFLMMRADKEEAGEFALGARRRFEREAKAAMRRACPATSGSPRDAAAS